MKKSYFLAIAILAMSASALAAEQTKYGGQCGLTDGYDSDLYVTIGKEVKVSVGAKLSPLQEKQIVAATIELADGEDVGDISTAQGSVKALVGASEGGDVYIENQQVNDQIVTVVKFYPGGNPYGVIFKKGTAEAIAAIRDSDVVCK